MAKDFSTLPEFNPGNNEVVAAIKKRTDELTAFIQEHVADSYRRTDALKGYEEAAMWAVKAATNPPEEREPQPGDGVLYRDEDGQVYPATVIRAWSPQCVNLIVFRDEFKEDVPQTEVKTSVEHYRPEEDVQNNRWFRGACG